PAPAHCADRRPALSVPCRPATWSSAVATNAVPAGTSPPKPWRSLRLATAYALGFPAADTGPHTSLHAYTYRRDLSFEPEALHVCSCEEHGDEAIAHIGLPGRAGSQARSFKEATRLGRDRRAGESCWHLILE